MNLTRHLPCSTRVQQFGIHQLYSAIDIGFQWPSIPTSSNPTQEQYASHRRVHDRGKLQGVAFACGPLLLHKAFTRVGDNNINYDNKTINAYTYDGSKNRCTQFESRPVAKIGYTQCLCGQNRVPFYFSVRHAPRTPSDWPTPATTRRWPHFRRVGPNLAT